MSELYASMLMIGVTLSLGSLVSVAAVGQFAQVSGQSSVGSSMDVRSSGTLVSMVYAAVQGSGSCPAYGGVQEGTTMVVALFDYGELAFAPSVVGVNATAYGGSYPAVPPGGMALLVVQLSGCAHQSGETVFVEDSAGQVFQFES